MARPNSMLSIRNSLSLQRHRLKVKGWEEMGYHTYGNPRKAAVCLNIRERKLQSKAHYVGERGTFHNDKVGVYNRKSDHKCAGTWGLQNA